MLRFIFALVLLGVALLAMALQRTYVLLSAKELKRRAREKDPIAQALYKAVAYGASLRLMLWGIVILAAAGSFVLIDRSGVPSILSFLAVAITLGYGFVWMPAHKATAFGIRIAVWLTPIVAWLMRYLYPVLKKIAEFIQKHRPLTVHTGLYDREDLLKLIEDQKHQEDSRISTETLELLAHTLTFGDKMVRDSMVPRRAVRMVSDQEPIGPILIKDLYDTGFSRFPVFEGSTDHIVGTLYLRDLVNLKHTGKVADVMHPHVYYVHEDHPLEQVLDAFLKTQRHLFIVVNSFEEVVGLITIEDILEQILGAKIVDEFDQYDDLRAVASHQAKRDHDQRQELQENAPETIIKPDVKPAKKIKADTKEPKKKAEEVVKRDRPEQPDGKNPYKHDSLKHLLYAAGFRDEALEIAFAVALAESAGKATAHNDDESTGDDSYGLFQINMLGAMGPERRERYELDSNEDLYDPRTNARVAYELSEGGKNWQPWSTYNNGAYKKYHNPKSDAGITA